jgi:hypothetical protein
MNLHMKTQSKPGRVLVAIKLLHTFVWAFFVVCILAIPIAAALHRFEIAAVFAGVVLLECLVLAVNGGRCPLTDMAARIAPNDAPNFDIYLPARVARYNKQIFGAIFVLGGLFALTEWLISAR